MHTDEHRKRSLVIFLDFIRTSGITKVSLSDRKFSLAKVLQALIFTHLYAAEKNACSIPECEHCINYILNTHKYYSIGKKEVVNTSQKILFLVYVSLHHAQCCFDGIYSIPCKTNQQNHHRNSCPMRLIVIYSIKIKKK